MGFNTLFKSKPVDKEVEEKYEVGKKLGEGNFATVYSVKERSNGKELALKVISRKRVQDKEYMVQMEIEVMKKLSHPNVISLVEVIETKKSINVITTVATGGDLFAYVTSKGCIPEEEAKKMCKEILTALAYLHTMDIVHRDIKPENILLNNPTEKKIVLIDFGLAQPIKDGKLLREACGSPEYVAPEQLRPQHHGYNTKADLWSVGVVTYIMLGGYHPFSAASEEDRSYLIRNGVYEFHQEKWAAISADGKAFVKKLIEIDTEERMDAKAALAHPWIVSLKEASSSSTDLSKATPVDDTPPARPPRTTSSPKLEEKPQEKPKTPISTPISTPTPTPPQSAPSTPRTSVAAPITPTTTSVAVPAVPTTSVEDLDAWKELEDLENASKIISQEETERMEREEREKQQRYQKERDRIASEEAAKRAAEEEANRKQKQEEDSKNVKKQQEIDDAFSELEKTMSGL